MGYRHPLFLHRLARVPQLWHVHCMSALGPRGRLTVLLIAQAALLGAQAGVYLADLPWLAHVATAALQALFALAAVFGPKRVGGLVEEVGEAVRGSKPEPPAGGAA